MTEQETKDTAGQIIIARVLVIGEKQIPRELFATLSQAELWAWLTEPDPAKFPPSMQQLAEYL